MQRFAILLAVFTVADLLAWWLSIRWLRGFRPVRWMRWTCHAFFGLQTAYAVALVVSALVGSVVLRRGFVGFPNSLQACLFIWHVLILPVSLLMWLLVRLGIRGLGVIRRWRTRGDARPQASSPAAPEPAAGGMSRRDFLVASVAMVPPLLAVGATGYGLPSVSSFRVRRLTLAMPGLPKGLEGFTITQISDLHVGRWASDSFLQEVTEVTNQLKADVVLFTGDLIDISSAELPRAAAVIPKWRARHGTYLIEGNHDLIENPLAFYAQMQTFGPRFLRGSSALLDHDGHRLQLLGLPWNRNEAAMAADVKALADARDPMAYPILLAHHPHAFDHAAAAGLPLTLSGHTHGGQLGLSPNLNAGQLMFRYVSGLYEKGASKLVVSNGTGNWFPLRVNAPAEIVHLTLRRA